MIRAIANLESASPYSQSRHYEPEKTNNRETARDVEARTWRERCHYNERGQLFIPPMAFKNCLSEAAKFISMPIPGKGKSTYTKNFEAGILVMEPMMLPFTKESVPGEWVFVPADGRRGGGRRVDKCFPTIASWRGKVVFYVLDPAITREVFGGHLEAAGRYIGIGRFRPRNNGYYGRFEVRNIDWAEQE